MLCQLETLQKQNVDKFKSKFESGAQMCSNWWRHFRGGASTNCNTFKCQNKIAKLSQNTHYLLRITSSTAEILFLIPSTSSMVTKVKREILKPEF